MMKHENIMQSEISQSQKGNCYMTDYMKYLEQSYSEREKEESWLLGVWGKERDMRSLCLIETSV